MDKEGLIELLNYEFNLWLMETIDGEPFVIVETWEQVEQAVAAVNIEAAEDPLDFDEVLKAAFGDAVEWGFSDEYDRCNGCGKVVRTSPDSYSWTPEHKIIDGELLCSKCLAERPEQYLETLINTVKSGAVDTIPVDPEDHGWAQVGDTYETGLYDHSNDNPEAILKLLNGHDIDVIFKIWTSQFETEFIVYVPEGDREDAERLLSVGDVKYPQGRSPAEICKRGLQDASKGISELKGRGIKYASIQPDGTAKVRLVSPEEFIEGIRDDE